MNSTSGYSYASAYQLFVFFQKDPYCIWTIILVIFLIIQCSPEREEDKLSRKKNPHTQNFLNQIKNVLTIIGSMHFSYHCHGRVGAE